MDVTGEWHICEWGDIATLEYGRSLRGYQGVEGRYRVYGTNGPIGWHDQPLCRHAGVIIGRKGAYRGVHYSPEPFFVIDTAFYLEATKQVDRRWAYYCLLTYDINGMDSGSAIPSTSREAFYRLPVRVPPLQEQRAIAHILGTLDDKIELNQRMNETLEAMARAIFQSWFVDFDPVRSKAAGRQPPGLAPHIAGLFPDAFEESELGEIPRGWHAEEIGELCDIALGGDWGDDQPSEKKAVEAVCLRGVDLEHLRHSGWADAPHRWLKRTSVAARRLDERDVLVAASGVGPIGRPLWVAHQLEAAYDLAVIYSNFCKRLRCKSVAMAVYVDRWLQLMRESGEIWEYANGTSIPNLDAKSLLSSKAIVVPPESILEFLLSIVRPVTERLYSLESRTLITLREVLLPKLISGELRVEDAESIVRRCT